MSEHTQQQQSTDRDTAGIALAVLLFAVPAWYVYVIASGEPNRVTHVIVVFSLVLYALAILDYRETLKSTIRQLEELEVSDSE